MYLNWEKYRGKSCRLKGWDYSTDGVYFITICTKDRQCYFGNVYNYKMNLSVIGLLVEYFWRLIPVYFPSVYLEEFIVMPNHIHGLLVIKKNNVVTSINLKTLDKREEEHKIQKGGVTGEKNPMLNSYSISRVLNWYKGRCTYEIRLMQQEVYFEWQKKFYDQIIFDQIIFKKKVNYIRENPLKWEFDCNNPKNIDLEDDLSQTIQGLCNVKKNFKL